MNIDEYLKKLKCSDLNREQVSLENLTRLQQAHVRTFAFENLDMHMNKRIEYASLEDTYDRLINKSRGGYCLQLNTLFAWLLKQLGYDLYLTESFVYNPVIKRYIRLPIHVIIILKLGNASYYVDVGTTRLNDYPFELTVDKIQFNSYGQKMKLLLDEENFYVLKRKQENKQEWSTDIKFKLVPRSFEYFKEMNDYVQTEEHPTIFFRTCVTKQFENNLVKQLMGNKLTEIRFNKKSTSSNDDEESNQCEEIRTERYLDLDQVKRVLREDFKLIIDEENFQPVDNLMEYLNSIK